MKKRCHDTRVSHLCSRRFVTQLMWKIKQERVKEEGEEGAKGNIKRGGGEPEEWGQAAGRRLGGVKDS